MGSACSIGTEAEVCQRKRCHKPLLADEPSDISFSSSKLDRRGRDRDSLSGEPKEPLSEDTTEPTVIEPIHESRASLQQLIADVNLELPQGDDEKVRADAMKAESLPVKSSANSSRRQVDSFDVITRSKSQGLVISAVPLEEIASLWQRMDDLKKDMMISRCRCGSRRTLGRSRTLDPFEDGGGGKRPDAIDFELLAVFLKHMSSTVMKPKPGVSSHRTMPNEVQCKDAAMGLMAAIDTELKAEAAEEYLQPELFKLRGSEWMRKCAQIDIL